MPYLHYNQYRYSYSGEKKSVPYTEQVFLQGWNLIESHPLFGKLAGDIYPKQRYVYDADSAASVESNGNIYINMHCRRTAAEWAFLLAHCLLHLAFGHFDFEQMPFAVSDHTPDSDRYLNLWNKACDIYITQFLIDIKIGTPTSIPPGQKYSIRLNSEEKIFDHLISLLDDGKEQNFGTISSFHRDMIGLEHPIKYESNRCNAYAECFAYTLSHLGAKTVSDAGGYVYDEHKNTPAMKAARWFIGHYPLLGSMAASYKIIEDYTICIRNEIEIAAIDATRGEIYINPTCGFREDEWKFVLAHEFLHAGLMHHKRSQGRDAYLWNIACDYVINGWLHEMNIGTMPPKGLLYDPDLKGMSAEYIYDKIEKDLRKFCRLATFRGYKKGDILGHPLPTFS